MDTSPTVKNAARQLVERLPEHATWDDLMYEIYVRQAIEAGIGDADAGRMVSSEEARRRLLAPR
jgi:predicted transcriptional regulator